MQEGKRVVVQPIPRRQSPDVKSEDLHELVCYYYPQYTYSMARHLPYRRVVRLIRLVRREQARRYLELTQISAAPHTKDGKGVQALIDRYQKEVSGG